MINKFYSSCLCKKYAKEATKIRKIIERTEKNHPSQIEDNIFLKELLNNKDQYKRVVGAYYIIKKYTGKSLYDVQIMAVLAMLEGNFIDVKTGEGKTIIIGAYCLIAEKPIHVVTVNNYLAEEAIRQLGDIYTAFDISHVILTDGQCLEEVDMKKDIIYGTGAAFAFKYIIKRFQRDVDYQLHTAVIDEVDYVLIDNATSSFAVGVGDGVVDNSTYESHVRLALYVEKIKKIFSEANVVSLNYDEVIEWANLENDFTNTIFINKSMKFIDFTQDIQDYVLSISNEYELEPSEALSFMYGIVTACYLYEKNVDYVVSENKIILVDRHNGRMLPNSKHDMYLNLSLLLKESLFEAEKIKNIGKIANQVYFLKYDNVIGLSGSLLPVMQEISELYKSNVIEIPKNKQSTIEKKYYFVKNKNEKLLNIIKDNTEKNKATLIICINDKEAEDVSNFLNENGYKNTLFNNTIEAISEEEVVGNAGKNKKITVSTLLFGRGTDICPIDDSVILSIIMYEEFGSERANVQISGRTGRQGRNGDVHILVSPDDKIFDNVDCKTKERINEKNYMNAIKKAISNIYSREKSQRENETYFAFYIDVIFESYYRQVNDSQFDDYFLLQMEDVEQNTLNITKKEEISNLIMNEAKKIIETINYRKKVQKGD